MLRNVPIDINIRNTKNVEGDIIKVEMPSAYDEVLGYPEFGMFGEFGDRLYPELKSGNITVGGSKKSYTSLKNLTYLCEKITGNQIRFKKILKTSIYDIPYYVTSLKKIKKFTKWEPKISLYDGLESTYNWMKKNQKKIRKFF